MSALRNGESAKTRQRNARGDAVTKVYVVWSDEYDVKLIGAFRKLDDARWAVEVYLMRNKYGVPRWRQFDWGWQCVPSNYNDVSINVEPCELR